MADLSLSTSTPISDLASPCSVHRSSTSLLALLVSSSSAMVTLSLATSLFCVRSSWLIRLLSWLISKSLSSAWALAKYSSSWKDSSMFETLEI